MLLFFAYGCDAYYIDQVFCRIRYAPIFGLRAISLWFYVFAFGRGVYPTRSGVWPDRTPNRYKNDTSRTPNEPLRDKTMQELVVFILEACS